MSMRGRLQSYVPPVVGTVLFTGIDTGKTSKADIVHWERWVQVAITCRHGKISDGVRDQITRKSEKLLTYFERVTAIGVTVDFEGDRVKVEILVDSEHKHDFVAHDTGEEVPSTFDRALHKMEHQIKKYKEKVQDHRRDKRLNEVIENSIEESESDSELE